MDYKNLPFKNLAKLLTNLDWLVKGGEKAQFGEFVAVRNEIKTRRFEIVAKDDKGNVIDTIDRFATEDRAKDYLKFYGLSHGCKVPLGNSETVLVIELRDNPLS